MKLFSEIIRKTLHHKREMLKSYQLSHAPSVGDMYEGLTREVFFGSLNLDLIGLKVVKGFITTAGKISRQMDCMLVFGEGEKIPFTDSYKWPADKVLAVIEVKKNLFFSDLESSYSQLQDAWKFHCEDLKLRENLGSLEFSTKRSAKEYISIFGELPPHYEDRNTLPHEKSAVYGALVREELAPLRVAIGYNGYKSEFALRDAINKLYDGKSKAAGYGTVNMPNLIISNDFSVLKINGLPYKSFWDQNYGWAWLGSSHDNPVLLLLELLIDKIERYLNITIDKGEDLDEEIWYPLMCARPDISKQGWNYTYIKDIPEKYRNETPTSNALTNEGIRRWMPISVTDIERDIVLYVHRQTLCEIDDPGLGEVLEKYGVSDVIQQAHRLLRLRFLIFWDSSLIVCPGKLSLIDVSGRTYCGDDCGDRLLKWAALNTAPPMQLNSPLNVSPFAL